MKKNQSDKTGRRKRDMPVDYTLLPTREPQSL